MVLLCSKCKINILSLHRISFIVRKTVNFQVIFEVFNCWKSSEILGWACPHLHPDNSIIQKLAAASVTDPLVLLHSSVFQLIILMFLSLVPKIIFSYKSNHHGNRSNFFLMLAVFGRIWKLQFHTFICLSIKYVHSWMDFSSRWFSLLIYSVSGRNTRASKERWGKFWLLLLLLYFCNSLAVEYFIWYCAELYVFTNFLRTLH